MTTTTETFPEVEFITCECFMDIYWDEDQTEFDQESYDAEVTRVYAELGMSFPNALIHVSECHSDWSQQFGPILRDEYHETLDQEANPEAFRMACSIIDNYPY